MRKSLLALVILCSVTIFLLNCAHNQQLVSIQVLPTSESFGDTTVPVIDNRGSQVQLQALGGYIHPPVTKNITGQVTWSSNSPQMMTVNSSGVLTVTGLACGSALISATVTTNESAGGVASTGAIVTGNMTATVVCFEGSGGGSGNPVLVVDFLGNGSGTVTSSPSGFTCVSPGPCNTQIFISGTALTLTATPNSGSTFMSWPECPNTPVGNTCSFTLATNPTLVTAAFNN